MSGKGNSTRRAIGIARVSVEGKRTEERLYSYGEQATAIEQSCDRDGLDLLYIGRERNVSGGADLSGRPELLRAVEAIESGDAELIVVAYFDRFFRSLTVQHEVVARVEAAGGELLALDHGRLTNGTAAERLNSNLMGAVAQFYREQSGEKSRAGQAAAVARGALPWSRVPLGYRRREDSTIEPVAEEVPIVKEVFARRLAGESYNRIRKWLFSEHGIERTPYGVQTILSQRLYIGELHFKSLVNRNACKPIIDREVFDAVQAKIVPRGPQAKSPRLLARLRIVRCGNCGTPMGAMKVVSQDNLPIYRCPSHAECPKHLTINADIAEQLALDVVKEILREHEAEGNARLGDDHLEARKLRDDAQDALDRAIATMTAADLLDEPAAVAKLTKLRQDRDDAQTALDRLERRQATQIIRVSAEDVDTMPQDAQRDLITALIARIDVAPTGRGTDGPVVRGVDRLTVTRR